MDNHDRELWEKSLKTKEYRKKAGKYSEEILDIQAVVGASGFGAGKVGKEKLWNASTSLTAWKEEGRDEIHRGEFFLGMVADDQLLGSLREQIKVDSLIRVSVRVSENGEWFLMTGPAREGDDPALALILEEQVKEVVREVEGLGRFTLDRSVEWFHAALDWLGQKVEFTFDQEEEEVMEDAVRTARALMADPEGWDQKIREYAAEKLLELANDWAAEEADPEELSRLEEAGERLVGREMFMERMELESIGVQEEGEFEFWFGDGDLFWGHSIHVTGNLEDGPDWAGIEG